MKCMATSLFGLKGKMMKKSTAVFLLAVMTGLTAAGCTQGTQRDIKHVGEDVKDDVNDAARTANTKVKNALS